jgi:hypothetical protein
MKGILVLLTEALVPFVEPMTNTCKHCGLTLQGMEREGEDICVSCLSNLCFPPSNNYSIIEGMIRQATDNPINKPNTNDTTEKTTTRKDQGRCK